MKDYEEGMDRQLQDSSYLLNNGKHKEEDSGNELLDKNKMKSFVFWSNGPLQREEAAVKSGRSSSQSKENQSPQPN